MGLNLTLIFLRGPHELGQALISGYDSLRFERDYEIFGQLKDISWSSQEPTINANLVPPQLYVEMPTEDGTEKRHADAYNEELTFVYASQLKSLKIPDDAMPKNKAIKAFVDALPDETPIILFWH